MGSCVSTPRPEDDSCEAPPAATASSCPHRPQEEVSERLSSASKADGGSLNVLALAGQPDYLDPRAWTDGLDVPVIKARATALEKGLNTVLNPLLDELEDLLDKGCTLEETTTSPSSQAQSHSHADDRVAGAASPVPLLTWENVQLGDFPGLFRLACKREYQFGSPESIAEATSAMLSVLHAISVAGERAELPVPPALLEISSLNRLLDVAGRITARSLTSEPKEAAAARWAEWLAAAEQLGLRERHLAVALSAPSKALMISMHMAARYGSGRVGFKVHAATAFSDSLHQADAMGLLSMTAGGILIYPTFSGASSSAAACTRQQQGHARSASVDLDEAARRRQTFFEQAGQQMLSGGGGEAGTTAGESPTRKRRLALFSRMRSGGRYWFNTQQQWSSCLERQYQWAGWLLGQCFANRTSLRVMLPDVLFEKLLKGPAFQATMEALSEFSAELAAGVRGALHVRSRDYRAQLALEGCPPEMPRRAFVAWKVKQALVADVHWQFAAFSQGFYAAVDREMLQCWRVTPSDLAELAAGRKLDGLLEGGVRSRSQQLPGGVAASAAGVIAPNAQAHLATSNAPVVNTLWKASPASQVDIRAQAGGNSFASLRHTASGTVIV